jgi:DHA2 family multidrug resistance protein-like MFS transporter
MLIASRALLGIAGATIAPSTLSLIRNMFHDDAQRTVAIGVWITAFSLGGALGPLFGGVLLEFFWWGSVFLLAVPVMALLLILGPIVLPEYKDPNAGRLDVLSAALSLVAVLAVVYGLKEFAQEGLGPEPIMSILVGLAVGALFVRRQTRLTEPLIDLELFRRRSFSAPLAVYTLGILVMFGAFFFIFQYLQLVAGLSPLRAGVVTLPFAISFIVGAMLAPVIVKRITPANVMAGGLAVAAVGFGMLTQVGADSDVVLLIASTVVFSLGLAPLFTLTNDLIIGSAPPERAGAASGISETGAELGGALSIAILGTLGTAVYRRRMEDDAPASLPAEQEEAAQSTLGGAVAVAEGLPARLGDDLLAVAREAFTAGMQVSALVSAVIAAGAAVFAAIMLRGLRLGDQIDADAMAPGEPVAAAPAANVRET